MRMKNGLMLEMMQQLERELGVSVSLLIQISDLPEYMASKSG